MTRLPVPAAVAPEALRGRYPHELERTWQPAGAPAVNIRALRHEDLALERRFISGLSPETLYLRVQYSVTAASERDLERLLDLDYYDRLAVAGFAQEAAGATIVGVSRYARVGDTPRADCPIVGSDSSQGRWRGPVPPPPLATSAKARATHWLESTTLAQTPCRPPCGRHISTASINAMFEMSAILGSRKAV